MFAGLPIVEGDKVFVEMVRFPNDDGSRWRSRDPGTLGK